MSICVVKSMPCIGHLFNSLLYLSQEVYRLSSSLCLKTRISHLLSEVRAGEKNRPIYSSTNSSYVFTEPYGNDSNQVAATSLKENGKS